MKEHILKVLHQQKQKYLRVIQGAGFAFGAPSGWLIVRIMEGASPFQEVSNNYGMYCYMLFGTMLCFIVFGYIIGKHEDILETLSILDPLTGLYNRRYFIARLDDEYSVAKRNKSPLSLAILDLDKFKSVNDSYGHPVGDMVLTATANAISSVVRQGETVARIGGEEFAVLLPGCTSDVAYKIVERIRQAINDSSVEIADGKKISVRASAGIACTICNADEFQINNLYEKADEALYQAKEKGRDKVVIF